MDWFLAVLLSLLFLVSLADIRTSLMSTRNRFINATSTFVISAIAIQYFEITELDNKFSVYIVACFFVSGIYFFYAVTTWVIDSRNDK